MGCRDRIYSHNYIYPNQFTALAYLCLTVSVTKIDLNNFLHVSVRPFSLFSSFFCSRYNNLSACSLNTSSLSFSNIA